MIEGGDSRDVELEMPTGNASVDGQAKLRDFGNVSFSFRKPLRHMVGIPNI